ncbi:MAG: hypothetical protein K9G33_14200 [Sneathiella sp.]|nr:hypothetical protein [Sneathiella sp.]
MTRVVEHLINQQAAEVAIVTLGSEGAVIGIADMKLHIRPPKVEVRSAVGAGDNFIGALTLGLASGWSLENEGRYAVAAAVSAVMTKASALCCRSQTDNFLKQMRDSTASAR